MTSAVVGDFNKNKNYLLTERAAPEPKVITLSLNTPVRIPEIRLRLTLKNFSDSRCPESVECIQAGEVGGQGDAENLQNGEKIEFRLGTATNPRMTLYGYKFELVGVSVPRQTLYIKRVAPEAKP